MEEEVVIVEKKKKLTKKLKEKRLELLFKVLVVIGVIIVMVLLYYCYKYDHTVLEEKKLYDKKGIFVSILLGIDIVIMQGLMWYFGKKKIKF